MVSVGDPVEENIAEKKTSTDSESIIGLNIIELSWFSRNHNLIRRLKLFALAAFIFGWWISATVLRATRHRWVVQTFFAWFFIAIIAFRFIPNSVVTRPVEGVWTPLIQKPFLALPTDVRYCLGWLSLLAIVLGSAFGFELENVRYSLNRRFF